MKLITKNFFLFPLIIIMILTYTQPDYLKSIPEIHTIFNFLKVTTFIVLIIYYISSGFIDKSIIIITCYLFLGGLITAILLPSNFFSYITNRVLYILPLSLLTVVFLKKNAGTYLKSLTIVFTLYIIVNFLFILIMPNGMWLDIPRVNQYRAGHFLGIGNKIAFTLVPGLTIVGVSSWVKHNDFSFNFKVMMILSFITMLLVGSSTGLISVSAFIILSFIFYLDNKSYIVSRKFLFTVYVVVFIIVVIFQSTNIFNHLIENVLGKKTTLTGRTNLWSDALIMIRSRFYFGYGIVPDGAYIKMGSNLYSSHNVVLQQFLEVGFIGVSLVIFLLSRLRKTSKENEENAILKILNIGIFSVFVSFLTEAYSIQYLFFLVIVYTNWRSFTNKNI